MKRLFEFRVYDIMKDDDNREFLNKVKDENPELYGRFMSLVGNKGLKIAKQKYFEFDPVEVAEREKLRKKEEKQKKKDESEEKSRNHFLSKYLDIVNYINNYLRTSPLRSVIKNVREEKNLINWVKQYKTEFKGIYSDSFSLTHDPIDSVKILPPNHKMHHEFGDSRSIEIKQYIDKLTTDKKVERFKFQARFNFEPYGMNDFIIDQRLKIGELTTYKSLTLEELNILLEKFKYYMSDKYKEDWKIEQEAEKYNL